MLLRARVIGGLPSDLVGSLTGLTQGRFPVHAKATYAGKLEKADRTRKIRQGANAAVVVESDGEPPRDRHLRPQGRPGDRRQRRQGRADRPHQAPRPLREAARRLRQHVHLRRTSARSPRPTRRPRSARPSARRSAASSGSTRRRRAPPRRRRRPRTRKAAPSRAGHEGARRSSSACRAERQDRRAAPAKERLFAHPERPNARVAGGAAQLGQSPAMQPAASAPLGFDKKDFVSKRMRQGARVIGGTDPRPHRQGARPARPPTCCSRSARPAAAPRASTRSRSSTAGSCSSRPRSTAPRRRTRSSARTPRRPRSARSC